MMIDGPDYGHMMSGFWVPDLLEEARRQTLAVAGSLHAEADQAFVDAISELDVGRGADGPSET